MAEMACHQRVPGLLMVEQDGTLQGRSKIADGASTPSRARQESSILEGGTVYWIPAVGIGRNAGRTRSG